MIQLHDACRQPGSSVHGWSGNVVLQTRGTSSALRKFPTRNCHPQLRESRLSTALRSSAELARRAHGQQWRSGAQVQEVSCLLSGSCELAFFCGIQSEVAEFGFLHIFTCHCIHLSVQVGGRDSGQTQVGVRGAGCRYSVPSGRSGDVRVKQVPGRHHAPNTANVLAWLWSNSASEAINEHTVLF